MAEAKWPGYGGISAKQRVLSGPGRLNERLMADRETVGAD